MRQHLIVVEIMRAAKFCSECGEKMLVRRRGLLALSVCPRCSPRFQRSRFWRIAGAVLVAVAAFLAGRYSTSQRPVYFIGAPVDLQSGHLLSNESREAKTINAASQTPSRSEPSQPLCGAPTKSGKPCRRKVPGGGHCYQHRSKFPPTEADKIESGK